MKGLTNHCYGNMMEYVLIDTLWKINQLISELGTHGSPLENSLLDPENNLEKKWKLIFLAR